MKSAQNLLKFGTFDISNMPVSILMSKMIFMKYLPAVRFKLLRIYWNLVHLTFRISGSRFWCLKLFSLTIYHFFGPNWSQNKKYSEFIEIGTLDISNMPICWCQRWFLWNIYQLPGQINSKIKIALKFMFDISSIPIWLRDLIKFSLNNYYMLCQNWSASLNCNLDYKM